MSLLSICQEAASQLGLRQPSTIVGSTDITAQILFRFANQAGKELMRYHDWQNLIEEVTFTSLATQEQTGALPSADYDRMVYNAEVWDRTNDIRFAGPAPQRLWQRIKVSSISGITGCWRIIGNELNILPVQSAGNTIAFEYISKRWAASSGGTPQSSFMADTDEARISEDLLVLEMVWRFRQSRGFAQYAEDLSTCEREKEKAAARDRGTGRIRVETNADEYPQQPYFDGTLEA